MKVILLECIVILLLRKVLSEAQFSGELGRYVKAVVMRANEVPVGRVMSLNSRALGYIGFTFEFSYCSWSTVLWLPRKGKNRTGR